MRQRTGCQRSALVVLFFALMWMAPAVGLAQTGVYGELVGKVVDSSGGALPGVTITVTGSGQIGTRTATTEADGSYRFPVLSSGQDYKVEFELVGFGKIIRNDVGIAVRETTSVNVTMQIASLSESVTVSAESSVVDASSARAGMSMRTDLLQEIPSGKDSSAILTLVPGVARQNLNVGGSATDLVNNVISNGTTQRQININGAETKAGSGDGRYNNYDAYEEINVESGAAGADTRRPAGGVAAELVAKSGGNDFHGMVQLLWYNHDLVGTNLNDKLRAQGITKSSDVDTLRQNTAQMGGPLMRNRLWWFASFHDYNVVRNVIGRTEQQRGRLTPYLGNVTYQMTSNQKVTLFYSAVPKIQKAREMSKFVEFLSSDNQEVKGTTRQAKWLGTFGSKMVIEGGAFAFKYWYPSKPQKGSGAPIMDTVSGVWSQGHNQLNAIRNNHRTEENVALTRFLGSHNDIKVGTDFYIMNFRQGNSRGQGADEEVFYQLADGKPSFVTLYSGPAEALRGQVSTSSFVQERFTAGRLTLNSGVRYDRYRGFLPAQSSLPATRWESIFPAQSYPKIDRFTLWSNFEPRLSAVFKLTKDAHQVIKASYGFYPGEYDPIGDSDYANGNSLRSNRYRWLGDLNGNHLLELNELGALVSRTIPGQAKADPGLKNSVTKETGLSYELELPLKMSLRVNYFYSWYVDGNVDTNTAIPASAYSPVPYLDPGPDGKAGTADDRSITVYSIDPTLVGGSAVVRQTIPGTWKTSHSTNVTIQRRMAEGWQLLASYGRNRVRQDIQGDANNPNLRINQIDVVSALESTNTFKILGSYMLPKGGIQVAWNYQFQTGLPFNRTLNVTGLPQGQFTIVADAPATWRYDNVKEMDIRIEKQLRLPKGQQVGLMLEGYNMFNASASTDSDGPGIGTTTGGNFGIISKVMPPRTWRLGMRYTF